MQEDQNEVALSSSFIVARGLRSILTKVVRAIALKNVYHNLVPGIEAFFGTNLTLEEEKTLLAVFETWRQHDCQEATALAAEIAARSSSLSQTDRGVSSTSTNSFLQRMIQAEHGDLFMYWAAGVRVRATFVKSALSAHAELHAARQVESFKSQVKALEPELEVLQTENKRLSSKKADLESSLRRKQDSLVETKKLIEEATAPEVSTEAETLITDILRPLKSAQLLTNTDIPAKKLVNARNSCSVPNSDKILGLIDLTLFGSAKDAIVFGVKALYFRLNDSPMALPYSELRNYDVACTLSGMTFSDKTNGMSIKTPWSQSTGKVVMDVAKAIQDMTVA
jgi:hypothetical protein